MSSGSLSAAGVAAAASSSTLDDDLHLHHHDLALPSAADVKGISILDGKDQALLALKSDVMAKLNKEVKSLDDDSWMFEGPRSCIHQILGPGGLRHRRAEISTRRDMMAPQK